MQGSSWLAARCARACTIVATTALGLGAGLALGACGEDPVRDNPLDRGGVAWGAIDPGLAAAYDDGAIALTWARVDAVEVLHYRLFRRDASAGTETWSLVGEVAQRAAAGDATSTYTLVDHTRLVGAPDLAWRMTLATPHGESAPIGEATFASRDDLDGDGAIDGDCDAGDAAVAPGLPEDCDGVDQDCDGETDEACGEGRLADGAPCTRAAECASGACSSAGLCGQWLEACDATRPCGGALACATAFGVCTATCGAAPCPGGMTCVAGWCLASCGADAACGGGERCLVPPLEPIAGGGCARADACDTCAPGALCVAAEVDAGGSGGVGEVAVACCDDADGDGRFAELCAYGSDCDDADARVASGCGTCATRADCAGGQCVLVADGEGLCGGPAGCHCPDGSACAVGEDPPRCVQSGGCLDASDCEIAALGRWSCEVVPTLGEGRRCVCDDMAVCPACVIDAECPGDGRCESGRCVQP